MQATPTTPETQTAPDQRLRLPELVAYRAAAARRRAEAFCDAPEYVLGSLVLPLTPRTFSMLVAVESHFVCGGRATEGDVRNYLWFHSAEWCHAGTPGWQRRKARALRRLNRELANPIRRLMGFPLDLARYGAALALAVADIRRLIEDALADCQTVTGSGSPVATMEAQLIATFAREFSWEPERTRNTPLRQLFQFLRCICKSRGEDIADAGEQEILAAHLRRRQAALNEESHRG